MKKVGKNQYVVLTNCNGANIFEKENKIKICFQMKQGEPIFSDVYEKREEAEKFIESLDIA